MKKWFQILLLWVCVAEVSAQYSQHFTISGYVKEAGSGESLIGVNVYLSDRKTGTVTNNFGFYSLTLPASDSITLTISYVGFAAVERRVCLRGNIELNVDLSSNTVLKEVVVTADNGRQSESVRMSVLNVPISQIKNVPGLMGEKDASATFTVPEKCDFKMAVDTDRTGQGNDFKMNFTLSFTDIAGEEDYYKVYGKVRGYYKRHYLDSVVQVTEGSSLSLSEEMFSDLNRDGALIKMKSENNYFYNLDSAFVVFYLLHINKDFYLYEQSVDNYNSDDNPFVEPSLVYSNVTGGLGVCTSYTRDSVALRIK